MAGAALVAAALTPPSALSQTTTVRTTPAAGGEFSVPVLSYKEMPFRVVVHQQRDFSCGSAALATLLSYHMGRKVREDEIFAKMYEGGDRPTIQRVGFSLLDMKRYLKSLGYDADGYRVPVEALLEKKSPSIVVVRSGKYKHFVVVKGVVNGRVLIGDPAFGLKTQTAAEFAKNWDGVVFLIHQPVDDAAREFNRPSDWALVTQAPLSLAARQQPSASAITRSLPPLYQITTSFNANPR